MRPAAVLLACLLALAACSPEGEDAPMEPAAFEAPAADMAPSAETADARRELIEVPDRGEASVRADLDVGIGTVTVGEAEAGALFQADVALPPSGLRPRLETSTTPTERGPQARVRLRLGGDAASPGDLDRTRGIAWRLLFSHQTPLDLALTLGAASADLDLTGVPLRRLALASGVGRTALRLDAPNPERGADVDITAGVNAFTGVGLGFLRARRFRFEGGVGRFSLDFRGAPPEPGAEATLSVGVGELEVILPAGAPLVVEAPGGRLSSVSLPPALAPIGGNRYATPGAERDPDAFTVRLASGPGRVRVRIEGRPAPPLP